MEPTGISGSSGLTSSSAPPVAPDDEGTGVNKQIEEDSLPTPSTSSNETSSVNQVIIGFEHIYTFITS